MRWVMVILLIGLLFPIPTFALNRGALGAIVDALDEDGRSNITQSYCIDDCARKGYDLSGCIAWCSQTGSLYSGLPQRSNPRQRFECYQSFGGRIICEYQ